MITSILVQFKKFCNASILQTLTANLFQVANKFFLFDFYALSVFFLFSSLSLLSLPILLAHSRLFPARI